MRGLLLLIALLLAPSIADAAWVQNVAFRSTSGFVTDNDNTSYELSSANYPHATACNGCGTPGSGTNIGWVAVSGVTPQNINAAFDVRIAGDLFFGSGVSKDYKIDAPSGIYAVTLAFGEVGAYTVSVEIRDGTNSCTTVTHASSTSGRYTASDANEYTSTTWPTTGSTKTVSCTIASGTATFRVSSPSSNFPSITFIGMSQTATVQIGNGLLTTGVGN